MKKLTFKRYLMVLSACFVLFACQTNNTEEPLESKAVDLNILYSCTELKTMWNEAHRTKIHCGDCGLTKKQQACCDSRQKEIEKYERAIEETDNCEI